MRFRLLLSALLVLGAFSAAEAAAAAPLRVRTTPAAREERPTTSAERRAERLRLRLLRRAAVEARLRARVEARSRTDRPEATRTLADRVLALVNDAREEEGLPALATHPSLVRTAQAYAEDMAARGFFAHEDPEGRSSGDRILAGGYAKPSCRCSWIYATGENLAMGQDTPEEAVEDWLASPGHRANILHERYEDTGIGYHDGHWVQLFGTSKVLP